MPISLGMIEEELRPVPAKGWVEMIRKAYEVDPIVCPQCGGTMKVIAFLADYAVVDRAIDQLKLISVADRAPLPLDKRQAFNLPSPTMGRGKIGVMNTLQAGPAETELLIFDLQPEVSFNKQMNVP